ncbi:hypothetical protein GCM10029964_126430 [Kibdelosporangium lantanae]
MNPLSNLNSTLALLAVVATLGYSLSCAFFPYKSCRYCRGYGKFRSSFLGGIRLCRACKGTGLRLRFGRRVYNALARTTRKVRATHRRNRRDDGR